MSENNDDNAKKVCPGCNDPSCPGDLDEEPLAWTKDDMERPLNQAYKEHMAMIKALPTSRPLSPDEEELLFITFMSGAYTALMYTLYGVRGQMEETGDRFSLAFTTMNLVSEAVDAIGVDFDNDDEDDEDDFEGETTLFPSNSIDVKGLLTAIATKRVPPNDHKKG